MAIPVHLQQFKAAGIYRVVFDKSTIMGIDSEILRLVVGYSEVGPFNIPVYVKSASDFRNIYGDISKKLEKRGVFFHRMAIQALTSGPILCLNLKKFAGETVDGATISTDFNPSFKIIDTVKINVEDIYDTSRFWELSADKLINLKSADNVVMDQYINIATTNTKESSGTFFIRKASGTKTSAYNISISDWYSDKVEEMPEYLIPYKTSKISDFFAEIYVFKGHFTADQVLASSTLKNYFEIATGKDKDGNTVQLNEAGLPLGEGEKPGLRLIPVVTNAYGDPVDTLDALYLEGTANPVAHYIGSLIPYFKNKKGQYVSLDILFNSDIELHNMMMSFNVDALEEGLAAIDLAGRFSISTDHDSSILSSEEEETWDKTKLTVRNLYNGTAKTNLLGNDDSTVIVDRPAIYNNIINIDENGLAVSKVPFTQSGRRVGGILYVNVVDPGYKYEQNADGESVVSGYDKINDANDPNNGKLRAYIQLKQVGTEDETVRIDGFSDPEEFWKTVKKLHAGSYKIDNDGNIEGTINANGAGTYFTGSAFVDANGEFTEAGPTEIISSIARIEQTSSADIYNDSDMNMSITFMNVVPQLHSDLNIKEYVYGSSVSFLPTDGFELTSSHPSAAGKWALAAKEGYNIGLSSILSVGDCLLADDGSTDRDENNEIDDKDGFYDNVVVQDIFKDEEGKNIIVLTGKPYFWSTENSTCLVVIEAGLNQEIGTMMPKYLEGYVYKNYKPAGTDMTSKIEWHKFILSALTEYKGLRTGLLNKSDIDYRYIVDTFESYVENGLKKVLSYLAKEKQSAFAILNFPAIRTFVKCPFSSYTDAKGVFNVDYIVKGFNKKKPAGVRFSLPEDADGASFCAFYTPLKFSDGYLDTIVPSAALVSNLFMEKYKSRQPYYIIAGPNYGNIRANGLVGPDYNYSQDELQLIEPYGVNCMIYRPGFGTFINANQTAKQTPVSALSKVNVRELVIYIQDEIEKVLQAYQWEFNNPTTRNAIKTKADLICSRVAANGGIQAFLNVMDESNNTPDIIDNEMAVLSTHIEPGMGCGKMVQELTLYRTGQMSAAIND